MSNPINFRLRDGKDDDLKQALNSLPSYVDRTEIIRKALRDYFFNNQKPITIKNNTAPQVNIPLKETIEDIDSKIKKSLGF